MEQYIIEKTDKSWVCLVEKQSIVSSSENCLNVGDTVKFGYPDRAVRPTIYSGKIVFASSKNLLMFDV